MQIHIAGIARVAMPGRGAMSRVRSRRVSPGCCPRPLTLAAILGCVVCHVSASLLVPQSPGQMVSAAAAAVGRAREAGHNRLIVKLIVPLLDSVKPEDLDPWPGGLAQQYPYAMDLGKQMMRQIVGCEESAVRCQVFDAEDACGLISAQGDTPRDDAACLLFLGCDQLQGLKQVDEMAGERLMILLNPQFRRREDFSRVDQSLADSLFFNRGYEVGYAFEEFACRGEDVKLVGSVADGWQSYIMLRDDDTAGIPLHASALPTRPDYAFLEQQINEQHPSPRWARMLDEADAQGLRFLRSRDQ
eukprot:6204840-Pleurochrysis_carterae.AAC.1